MSELVWIHRFNANELGISSDETGTGRGPFCLVPTDARSIFFPQLTTEGKVQIKEKLNLYLSDIDKTVEVSYTKPPSKTEHRLSFAGLGEHIGAEGGELIQPNKIGCFYKKDDVIHFTIASENSAYDFLLKEFPQRGRDSNLVTKAVFVSENVNQYQVNSNEKNNSFPPPHQVIYFGSPGTGKSHTVEEKTEDSSTTRITFHPDSDYQSFVGSYRPEMVGDDIQYKFVPQNITENVIFALKHRD